MNLDGGWTGEDVDPVGDASSPTRAEPVWPGRPGQPGRSALFEIPNSTRGFEAACQRATCSSRSGTCDYTPVDGGDIAGRARPAVDVLVIPDGYRQLRDPGARHEGQAGPPRLGQRRWPDRRLAGRRRGRGQGRRVDRSSSATRKTNMPGHARPGRRSTRPARWPPASAIATGSCTRTTGRCSRASGTAVGDLPGAGHARLRDVRPGHRGRHAGRHGRRRRRGGRRRGVSSRSPSTRTSGPGPQGTQRMLWNAIVGPDPAALGPGWRPARKARAAAEKAAARRGGDAARPRLGHPHPGRRQRMRRRRPRSSSAAAPRSSARTSTVTSLFLVANRHDLSYDEHPFFTLVVARPREAGIRPPGGQPAVASTDGPAARYLRVAGPPRVLALSSGDLHDA